MFTPTLNIIFVLKGLFYNFLVLKVVYCQHNQIYHILKYSMILQVASVVVPLALAFAATPHPHPHAPPPHHPHPAPHHPAPYAPAPHGYCDPKAPPACALHSDLPYCLDDPEYPDYEVANKISQDPIFLKKYSDVADQSADDLVEHITAYQEAAFNYDYYTGASKVRHAYAY